MSLTDVKALTFDTGGTILDWHTGFSSALRSAGTHCGLDKDWGQLANEMRRRSLKKMLNLGQHKAPEYNFDDAHRMALDEILNEQGLSQMNADERRAIWWEAFYS